MLQCGMEIWANLFAKMSCYLALPVIKNPRDNAQHIRTSLVHTMQVCGGTHYAQYANVRIVNMA